MKTLTIWADGSVEWNVDGMCQQTNTSDEYISKWVVDAINQIIAQLQGSGAHYVHFEDDGYRTLFHKRRLDIVEDWTDPTPDVFTNLSRAASEYEAAKEADENGN